MADAPQGALTAARGAGLGALVGALDGWRIVGDVSAGTTVGGAVALVAVDVVGSACVVGSLAFLWGRASRRWPVVGTPFWPPPVRAAVIVAAFATYQADFGAASEWPARLGWFSAATLSAFIWTFLAEHAVFRRWALVAAALFGFGVLGSTVRQVRSGVPATLAAGSSVVVVTVDGLRRDAIGAYGGSGDGVASETAPREFETPNLDALAESSVVFDDAISPVPIPLPAHAAMFTGIHPLRLGTVDSGTPVPVEAAYVPELLYRAGWATGAFISSSELSSRTGFGLSRGFEVFDDSIGPMAYGLIRIRMVDDLARLGRALLGPRIRAARLQRAGDDTLARFLAWRDRQRGPYFAWIHLAEPMPPFEGHGTPGGEGNGDPEQAVIDPTGRPTGLPFTAAETMQLRSLYHEEVAYIDRWMGLFVRELDRRPADARTVVIFAGTGGVMLGEHRVFFEAQGLNEQMVRVPLMIHGPEWLPRRIEASVRLTDVAPTLLSVASVRTGFESEGVDLLDYVSGRRTRSLSTTLLGKTAKALADGPLIGFRGPGEKVIVALAPPGAWVYDLDDDTEEAHPNEDARVVESAVDALRPDILALRRWLGEVR